MMYKNSVIARLRPGVSPAQAAAETSALARRIQGNYPASLRHAFTLTIGVTPLADEITGPVRRPLLILFSAVGIVLLVACVNLASIVLSRSVARQREIGVRAALGAGRLRLFRSSCSKACCWPPPAGRWAWCSGRTSMSRIPRFPTSSLLRP